MGFAASALLSYSLVMAFTSLPSEGLGSVSGDDLEDQSGPYAAPLQMSFRSDLIWHGDSLITTDPRSTDCSVMGTRYISPTGERAFLIRFEFGSYGAARRALARERGRALREEPFESGLGSVGKYIPQYYLQFDPKREFACPASETEYETCDHADVWLEGDQRFGV